MRIQKQNLLRTAVIAVGLISVPCSALAASTNTVVSSTISPAISLLTSSGAVDLSTDPSGSGSQTMASDDVAVSTNNTAGYTLKLSSSSAQTALISGSDSIPAHTGTLAAPSALAINHWGYRVDGVGGFGAGPTVAVHNAPTSGDKFAGVPASGAPDTLRSTNTTATSDTTKVWYGLAANTDLPSGNYSNTVTYTAVTN